jgi:hypothetical protein
MFNSSTSQFTPQTTALSGPDDSARAIKSKAGAGALASFLTRGRARLAATVLVAAAAFSATALGPVASAGATSLSEYPTFECYSSGGHASLRVDKLLVNEDGQTTRWFPEVLRWTGRRWSPYRIGKVQTFADGDGEALSSLGTVLESPEDFNVAAHSFYEVKIGMASTDGRGVHYVWAQALMGHYGTYRCHT